MPRKAKKEPLAEMPAIERAHHSGAWLEQRLQQDILEGRVMVGNKLFSSERLAEFYSVDKMTANRVVQRLARDGLLRIQRGSGTFLIKPRTSGSAGILYFGRGTTEVLDQYESMLREIRLCLQKYGYTCTLMNRDDGGDVDGDNAFGPALGRVAANKFDIHIGVGIINREYFERLCWLETPVLSLDFAPGLDRVSSVSADGFNAGYSAAQLLLKNGHERFLFVPLFRGSQRLGTLHRELDSFHHECGWRYALQSAGKQENCIYLESTAKEADQRKNVMEALFSKPGRPTAIFGTGFLKVEIEIIKKLGLRIPQDVSIVTSSWDEPDSRSDNLDITRYKVAWREMAREAVRILDGLMGNKRSVVQRVMVNAHFHEGNTMLPRRRSAKA
jgi:DNA-binding LacI/PurR family transcriptional regulator